MKLRCKIQALYSSGFGVHFGGLMGGIFSSYNLGCKGSSGGSGSCKQQRVNWCFKHSAILIPGLPNDISLQILARVPRVYYLQLKLVSRSWMEALSTTAIYELRRELKTTEEVLFILCRVEENLIWYALDPVSQKWQKSPFLPHNSTQDDSQRGLAIVLNQNSLGSRIKNFDVLPRWLLRGGPLDKNPLRGCSIAAVNGCLYVVGGFSRTITLKCAYCCLHASGGISKTLTLRCVWRYDPILNVWNEVRPMLTGRAYSKTGVVNNKLYVFGGVRTDQRNIISLQSAEVYDPETDEWSEIPSIPCSKVMPVFDYSISVAPIATGLTPYNGKLYLLTCSGRFPFRLNAAGKIYDPESNLWVEMPVGMFEGWPDEIARNRLSVVVDDHIYALDLLNRYCFDSARIKVYDKKDDSWKVFSGKIPMSYSPINAESPCLLAGFGGKLHVIIKDAESNIAVHEASTPMCHSSHLNSLSNLSSSNQSSVDWKLISSMRAGPAELVSCQILRI